MNFNFVSKNYTLTPNEEKIIAKKVNVIKKIIKNGKGNPVLKLEIEELSKIDDLGNQYRCEVNFLFYDKSVYIEKLATTLRNAVDDCFLDLKNQIVKDTKKFKTKIIKKAFKNKYSFLNKLLGRKSKDIDQYENIE